MKRNGIPLSILPFIVLIGLMFLVVRFFGAGALDGASQMVLLVCAGLVIFIATVIFHVPWKQMEEAIAENILNIGSAIIILIFIGAIGGSWMVSGIVPTLIVYGLQIITPGIYLFAACIISALVSLMTGSSWTTIATIGVALIAIGGALGFSQAWCAGAIISGAYFGDKISPLSDTTILASSMSGTPLFTHIRYMLITTTPAFVTALVIYLVASLCHPAIPEAHIDSLDRIMRATFNISPWLLAVPLAVGIMIWKKMPAMITLLCAALMAGITALIAQPGLVARIGGGEVLDFGNAFRGTISMMTGPTSIKTVGGDETFDALVSTGGIAGIMPTIFLIVSAATFGGTLVGSGMIEKLTEALTRRIKSRTGLVGATLATGIFSNLAMGDQYLSIILTSRLYKNLYERLGYEGRLLSRSTEDSATITSVLIPWNSCGMTQATVLRVPTFSYMPFCFFNLLSPISSLLVAATGYRIAKRNPVGTE